MKGRIISVEPLSLDHEEALFAAGRAEEIWEWWAFNPARDREAFHAWMVDALAAVADGRKMRFAIIDAAGEPIGATSYCEPRPDQRSRRFPPTSTGSCGTGNPCRTGAGAATPSTRSSPRNGRRFRRRWRRGSTGRRRGGGDDPSLTNSGEVRSGASPPPRQLRRRRKRRTLLTTP